MAEVQYGSYISTEILHSVEFFRPVLMQAISPIDGFVQCPRIRWVKFGGCLEKKKLAFCRGGRYNKQENFERGARAMTTIRKSKCKAVPAVFVSIVDIVV